MVSIDTLRIELVQLISGLVTKTLSYIVWVILAGDPVIKHVDSGTTRRNTTYGMIAYRPWCNGIPDSRIRLRKRHNQEKHNRKTAL